MISPNLPDFCDGDDSVHQAEDSDEEEAHLYVTFELAPVSIGYRLGEGNGRH
jgi:hypothetical protein